MIGDESQRVREGPRSGRGRENSLSIPPDLTAPRRAASRRDVANNLGGILSSLTSIINARKNNRERDYRKPGSSLRQRILFRRNLLQGVSNRCKNRGNISINCVYVIDSL